MKKFFFSLFLLFVFILPTSAFALSKGDRVSFGKYNGSLIIWRVFDESETALTLISDKVLDAMQYDDTSANWENSAIRMWLNSAGNPSSGEKGFLCSDNFSSAEYNAIMTVERQYTLNSADINEETLGEEEHIYRNNPKSDILANYDIAYKNKSMDRVFLPSISDIQTIIKSSELFGRNYHLATPTKHTVSSFFDFGMREGEPWHYWLMDSLSNSVDNIYTRSVTRDNRISFQNCADEWVGIRPMCCIEKGKFTFSGGDGSNDSPYILNTDEGIYITCDTLNITLGESIPISVYTSSLTSGQTVVKYINGERSYSDSLTAVSGLNEVYYCILDAENNIISKSNSVSVFASDAKIKSVDNHFENIYEMKKTDIETIELLSENITDNVICGQFDKFVNSNFLTKVTCKEESQTAKFKIENIPNSKNTNAKILGFDLFINELSLTTEFTETKKFFDISLVGDETYDIETLFITDNSLHNVITDAFGNMLSQDKWYTVYLIYCDENNGFKYSLYIAEKGALFKNARLAKTDFVSGISSQQFTKGISLNIYKVQEESATIFVDNIFSDNLLSVLDERKYALPGESINFNVYIAPGFDNAKISFLGEEITVFDNGSGFYSIETKIPENIPMGSYQLSLSADYEEFESLTESFDAVRVAGNMYTYIKTDNGRDYIYDIGGVDNMYIAGNKAETGNYRDIKNAFDISFPSGYQADITYSFDTGASGEENDKSLKLKIDNLVNADGTPSYIGIGAYNTGEIAPRDSILKVKYDIKFSSADFVLALVTKNGDTWNKSVPILSDYASEYFAGSNIKFEPDRWYTITGIYDLLLDKLDVYIDDIHLKEVFSNISFENTTVTQLHLMCSSNEEGKNIFWIDNLSKEYIPQYGGIKDFNPFVSKDEPFSLELSHKILDTSNITLSLNYDNGEAAGTARLNVDENWNTKITVTPFKAFDENRKVMLTIYAGRAVVDVLEFVPKKTETASVGQVLVSEDDSCVYAFVSAEGEGEMGHLFLVSYGKGVPNIINISASKLEDCENRREFFVKIRKTDDDAYYKAFVIDLEK